ncbi:MAG: YhbY family RNA-binding protein [Sphaerochaetaceae bacterium]|nr:YhbY family RNA-binding protein [Sphaerochaetaceae bacterium]
MNSKTRSYLRSLAQPLSPIVMVGKSGLSESVISALDSALTDHELVKVKFQGFKDEIKSLSAKLAEDTDSELICIIGFTSVFFRQEARNPERKIHLEEK